MEDSPLKISKDVFYGLERQLQGNLAEKDLRVLATQPEIIRGNEFYPFGSYQEQIERYSPGSLLWPLCN
ncbi:MAG: hypothetical protein L3J17_04730 [Candidatus Jettenia sp.]|nr:MAG: hypothetical protein L3J17_04730 [Candidatus Jettenia sp.]